MQMILLILEISVDPVNSQEIQRFSCNTATFFGIDDIINFDEENVENTAKGGKITVK